jgi:four helix bundle protein
LIQKQDGMKSYKDLDICIKSNDLSIGIYKLTLTLPNYELYEQGSQLRRSSKSIKDNIVEGYGRRKYKLDFIRFLTIAYASLLEGRSQLEMIYDIHRINEVLGFIKEYDSLGAKIYSFIRYVEADWKE